MKKSDTNIEAQWLIINRPNCKNVVICNGYRPPTGKLQKSIEYLEDSLQLFDPAKVEIFVMGDLNVNYIKKISTEYKKLNFFVESNSLKAVAHGPIICIYR